MNAGAAAIRLLYINTGLKDEYSCLKSKYLLLQYSADPDLINVHFGTGVLISGFFKKQQCRKNFLRHC